MKRPLRTTLAEIQVLSDIGIRFPVPFLEAHLKDSDGLKSHLLPLSWLHRVHGLQVLQLSILLGSTDDHML